MKSMTKICIATLVTAKIVLGSLFVYQIELGSVLFENNAIASETGGAAGETEAVGEDSNQEETIDLAFLIEKRDELNEQAQALSIKREELLAFQKEIDEKLVTLGRIRDEINAQKVAKETVEGKKMKHLIKIYTAIKPQRAAGMIEKMDMGFSLELLSRMKGDVVGKILSFVDLEKAARITEGLAKKK